jgi:hypothetical protein
MENLTLEEMEATRGGFFNHSLNHNNVTVGNTATSVNVAAITGSANKSGGITVVQEADSAAGNISA